MFIDARRVADSQVIESDVCIVGAGAAGISLALEFADTATRVCLLEAGGFEFDEKTQALNKGKVTGRQYHDLMSARLRFFGGTTNHWHGWCRPLDEIDFEKRAYIPHSGWPITLDDLNPYYGKARELCELNYSEGMGKQEIASADLPSFVTDRLPEDNRATYSLWQVSPPTRFGPKYRDRIEASDNIHAYLYANVVEIETNDEGTRVTRLRVATLEGSQLWIQAGHFVLAGGGIEVPRLLLASNAKKPAGIGNDYDQVGRYFMLHPHLWVGRILTTVPVGDLVDQRIGKNWKQKPVKVGISLTSEFQHSERLPNHVMLLRETPEKKTSDGLVSLVTAMADKMYNKLMGKPDVHSIRVLLWLDHMPNPDSRVTLGTESDALGMPRPVLDWRLSPGEKQQVRRTVESFGQVLGALGAGRLQLEDWLATEDDSWPKTIEGDYHHMGGTRMSDDPRHGVVDANCRVHDTDNLYVASSSVFTTAGSSNPTLTIVAMALRLADHIKRAINS